MWRYLALLISTIIGILILAIIWHVKHLVTDKEIYSVVPLQRCLYSKEYKHLKAGDIIYMRSSISSMQEIIIPYVYKHIAIIVEIDNKLYIAESSNKKIIGKSNDKLISRKRGVNIYPLQERLMNVLGVMFIVRLNKSLSNDKQDILIDTILEHIGKPYPHLIQLYMVFILNIPIKIPMYCHIFVYTCLRNMGIVPYFSTADEIGLYITSIYNYELNDGYKYHYPKQLVYDIE